MDPSRSPVVTSESPPIIHVSPTGDDSHDGRWDRPKLTVQAAINAVPSLGGTVRLAPGATFSHTGLLLRDRLTLESSRGTVLLYTPSGSGVGVDGRSLVNIKLQGIKFQYSDPAYTGNLLDFSKSTSVVPFGHLVENCNFGGSTSSAFGATLIELNGLLEAKIRQTSLGWCTVGIDSTGANQTNVIELDGLVTSGLQAQTAWIRTNGNKQSWLIRQCAFEPIAGNAPGAYVETGNGSQNVTFIDNWFGDNVAAGSWITVGQSFGLTLLGNRINVAGNATGLLFTANTCLGVTVMGNYFNGSLGGVPIDFGATTGHAGIFIAGNGRSVAITPQVTGTIPTLRSFVDIGGGVQESRGTTASRPSAATAGASSRYYDTTLTKPIWSDGTNWRDAAGTIV